MFEFYAFLCNYALSIHYYDGCQDEGLWNTFGNFIACPLDMDKVMKVMRLLLDTQNDLDWILILFFIYLDSFRVEKFKESTCKIILVAGPILEN
jgi:hypothetical protein